MEVKYYPDSLDGYHFKSGDFDTIQEALEHFGIQEKPLCVIINGHCPDYVDLDANLELGDVVEIRHLVEGNANETWATIVSVAIIAAAIYFPPSALLTGAIIAGSLLAGAIMKAAPIPTIKDQYSQENAIESNDYSLANANNKIRSNEPIPIPMGSIRMSPDVYTFPLITRPNYFDYFIIEDDSIILEVSKSNVSLSSQTFSFGFGDFDLTDRRIGGYEIIDEYALSPGREPNISENELAGFSDVKFRSQFPQPSQIRESAATDNGIIGFAADVNARSGSQLINNMDNDKYVSTTDHSIRNWIRYEGKQGQPDFQIVISGKLYAVAGSSYGANTTYFQIQAKRNTETDWRENFTGKNFSITNDNAQDISVSWSVSEPISAGEFLQVRIRKAQADSVDNTTSKVCSLSITTSAFTSSRPDDLDSRLPINISGLYVTNKLTVDTTTNEYSAMLEGKCWVFEDGTWEWKHTRNPAWWFLYFAHGGFFNIECRGEYQSFPFSPTNCWQNYVGHPTNQELMWGGGYSNEQIDMDKIEEWALFCDDQGLFCDMILRDDITVAETLEKIANTGRASVTFETELLSVIIEDKTQLPVTAFGMANILMDTFSVNYESQDSFHKIICKFSDRGNQYETEEVFAFIPFSQAEKTNVSTVNLVGVTSKDQAQRECNLLAARQYFQSKTYTWDSDHEGFLAKRGDLVYLSHDTTHFGYSGRVNKFIVEDKKITGIQTNAIINADVKWVIVKLPNNEIKKLRCKFDGNFINFIDPFAIEDAPYHLLDKKRDSLNEKSRFFDTIAEDYTFIADIKENVGKLVRIRSVEQSEENRFSYSAVDEDSALWAFEFGYEEASSNQDDAIGIVEVFDISYIDLGDGNIKLRWNSTEDTFFIIVNEEINAPIDINGRFSISDKEVTIKLDRNTNNYLKVSPIGINEKIISRSASIKIWPK